MGMNSAPKPRPTMATRTFLAEAMRNLPFPGDGQPKWVQISPRRIGRQEKPKPAAERPAWEKWSARRGSHRRRSPSRARPRGGVDRGRTLTETPPVPQRQDAQAHHQEADHPDDVAHVHQGLV